MSNTSDVAPESSTAPDGDTRAKCALLVIDVLNDSVAPGGTFERLGFPLWRLKRVIPRIQQAVAHARAASIPVVYVRSLYDRAYLLPCMAERFDEMGIPDHALAAKGEWGAEFLQELQWPPDLVIVKSHYSALCPRRSLAYRPGHATALEAYLLQVSGADEARSSRGEPVLHDYYGSAWRAEVGGAPGALPASAVSAVENPVHALKRMEVNRLLLCGYSTHVCVAATAYSAHQLGFYITIISDATAGEDEQRHHVFMQNLTQFIARSEETEHIKIRGN